MNLIINGDEKTFENGMNISAILKQLRIEEKVMACAVNMEIVKKEQWVSFVPNEGDKIEFLQFVGGG